MKIKVDLLCLLYLTAAIYYNVLQMNNDDRIICNIYKNPKLNEDIQTNINTNKNIITI